MTGNEVQTPAYVFDIPALRARAARIKKAIGKSKLCYAVKANPFLIRALLQDVDCFEVCSPGEYRICERLHVPAEKIVLSGVYKEESDIRRIVGQCGDRAIYTVESPSQLALLGRIAADTGLYLRVCLRLSSGNQFGMDRETLYRALRDCEALPLRPCGIQYYAGTQKKPEKIRKEWETLTAFADELRAAGFDCPRIEYGPGASVSYFRGDKDAEEETFAVLQELFGGENGREVVLETGRFLAADCGAYHTTVVDSKHTCGVDYAITDGGINHLNYYGQMMAMKLPFIRHVPQNAGGEEWPWTVCGSLCTTADVLVKNCPFTGLAVGDRLIFQKAGAYSVTEGIYLFLSRDMPRIYMRTEDGETVLCRDVLRTDEINRIQ